MLILSCLDIFDECVQIIMQALLKKVTISIKHYELPNIIITLWH